MEQGDYVLEVQRRKAARESLLLRQKKAHICLLRQCVLFSTKSADGGRNPTCVG